MAVVTQVHLAVAGQLVAQQLGGLVHGDEAAVGVLAAEAGLCGGVVVAEDDLAGAALDAVAADDGAVHGGGAVEELQLDVAVGEGLDLVEALAKVGDVVGDQLDHLVEEVGAVHGGLARGRGQRVDQLALLCVGVLVALAGLVGHAAAEVEPDLLLAVPLVECGDLLEALAHLGGDERHGASSVGAEGHAGPDLAECVCRLIQGDADVLAQEADCEGEAGDAAADDGNVEVAVGGHGAVRVGGGGGRKGVLGRRRKRDGGCGVSLVFGELRVAETARRC